MPSTDVIIPALNEENTIGKVVRAIPKDIVRNIIVVDNGSTDKTVEIAKKEGCIVLKEQKKGYGAACLRGIKFLEEATEFEKPDIVLFIDGDFSDYPEEATTLLEPIENGLAEFVIGSRLLGNMEKGAMPFHQKLGNTLSGMIIGKLYGVKVTDLGPFRAICFESLLALNMQDQNYGWTVEMQLKAAKQGLNMIEVPVSYRKRGGGKSKVSGTIKGSYLAATKILSIVLRYAFK